MKCLSVKTKGIVGVCVFLCVAAVFVLFGVKSTSTAEPSHRELFASVTSPLFAENVSIGKAPDVSAEACVLIDGKSGAVLFEKNATARLPMASTTKIMTAKIILERMSLDTVVTVPTKATLVEGSSSYLRANEKITVEKLLYGLLLDSGNDSAYTLAEACSGSVEEFARLMNEEAEKMGLHSTSFANPHGLTAENHFTTAYELAFITMQAMKNEKFCEIVSEKNVVSPSLDGKVTRYHSNHNKLLRTYDGAVGVKTGYTKAAGRCLVSAARRENELYIAVTLNDGNDWRDHTALLDYAFDGFESVEIAPHDGFAVYKNGKRFCNTDGVYLTVSSGAKPQISYEITLSDDTGTVLCYADGREIGKFGITADAVNQ